MGKGGREGGGGSCMKAWQSFMDSLKQGVKPQKYDSTQSDCFLASISHPEGVKPQKYDSTQSDCFLASISHPDREIIVS